MMSKLLVLVAMSAVLAATGCPKATTSGDTAADLGTTPGDTTAGATVPPGGTTAEPGATPAGESHRFPVLADLQHVCGQSVLGQDGSEILWDLFWSARAPADVAQAYRETLGTDGLDELDGGWTWRAPVDGAPDHVLDVMAADASHPDCGPVPADAKTVAVFSEMFRREPPQEPPTPTPTPTPTP